MGFNPFGVVESYPAMLSKIAWSTTLVTGAALYVLARRIPAVDHTMNAIGVVVPIENVSFPAGLVLSAIAAGLISRFTKLHDRVSSILGIRRRFDVEAIIVPMAHRVGVDTDSEHRERLAANRTRLMKDIFYRYASGGNSVIDKHYVILALDQWSWFWIMLEAQVVLLAAAALLAIAQEWTFMLASLTLVAVGCIGERYSYRRSLALASDEIDQILDDQSRKDAVSRVLSAV